LTIKIPALSPEAHRAVLIGAAAITLASVVASEIATFFISLAFNLSAGVPAYVVAGVIPLFLASFGSYGQLKRLEQARTAYRELERNASTDWLTGSLNYPAFVAAASAAARIGTPGAMIVIDIDGLKSLNHKFGNDRGDEALCGVAKIIRANVTSSDLVGRIGGDAFGIYLRIASDQHAREIADAIREGVQDIAFASEEASQSLSVTIGVATAAGPTEFLRLFHLADEQLDIAKENGRNRIAITAVETERMDQAAA
jgi:diguanylate cyclase (GGDEF)-like protein